MQRESVFTKSTIVLCDDGVRKKFIDAMQSDLDKMENFIINLENILLQEYTLKDILIQEDKYKISEGFAFRSNKL
ncbi:MAG: hypothetical protein Q9M43_04525 [Sulfurimonas sp.]|nr:hypothetical protein [Sulfurimonas sp.]